MASPDPRSDPGTGTRRESGRDPGGAPSVWPVALAGMAALAAAMGIGRFVYTPILPSMMDALGLSASQAGTIAASNYGGYLLGALLAGGGWGQGREKAVVLVSLLLLAASLAAMALTADFLLFNLLRFLAGLCSALVLIFASALVIGHLAVAGRGGMQAWHFGGVGAGIAISSLLVGLASPLGLSWRFDWLASALLALALTLLVARLLPSPDRSVQKPPAEPVLLWTRPLLLLVTAYGLFGIGYIVTATFVVAILRDAGSPVLFESASWLAAGLAAIPSVWLWSRLVPRLGASKTFAAACLFEAAGVAGSVLVPAPAGPVIGAAMLGGTFVAITALAIQHGRILTPRSPRRAIAALTATFSLGQVVGPLFAGRLADLSGDYGLPSLGAAAMLVLAGLLGWQSGTAAKRLS